MVNADMREYQYYTYGDQNGDGQATLSGSAQGVVKMAIYTTTQSVQDNINYTGATYFGLTHNAEVNNRWAIQYGSKRLKVLYVTPLGRYKQVFMAEV
jgi:hypothetical protein